MTDETLKPTKPATVPLVDDVGADAEVDREIAGWHPYWKRPISPEEWDKLVRQRAVCALSARDTYQRAVESNMPLWFIQIVARNKYTLIRKYQRTMRRAEIEKSRLAKNLLHALGLRRR